MSDYSTTAPDVRFGGWSMSPAPDSFEVLCRGGYDFVVIDLQHGGYDLRASWEAIRMADLIGVPAYVRLGADDAAIAPRLLDAGAAGLIVAMVDDPEDAAAWVARCRYQPEGRRSYGGQRIGLRPEPPDVADVRPHVFAMIETTRASEAVDEIAAVDGLAGLWLGEADLARSLGLPIAEGRRDARWCAIVEAVAAAARAHGIGAGNVAWDGADARDWVERGYTWLSVSSDLATLRAALRRELAIARGGAGQAAASDAFYGSQQR